MTGLQKGKLPGEDNRAIVKGAMHGPQERWTGQDTKDSLHRILRENGKLGLWFKRGYSFVMMTSRGSRS